MRKSSALAFCVAIFLSLFVKGDDFTLVNKRSVYLRDQQLRNPIIVDKDSEIQLDAEFLKEYLGTSTPTAEQIQNLLLNPEQAKGAKGKRMVTQSAKDSYTGKDFSDYFFPVIVKTTDGKIRKGKMALQSYYRRGQAEAKPSSTGGPRLQERATALREQNKPVTTEATTCLESCSPPPNKQTDPLGQVAAAARRQSTTLMKKYEEFARDFSSKNKITRTNSPTKKAKFVKELVEKFGVHDAGLIMAALTGYGESPHRGDDKVQLAEIAAVLKVLENRTGSQFRSNSTTLRDIGINQNSDARLTNILSDQQFSVWNDFDNSLSEVLSYHPDKAGDLEKRRMSLAFRAQEMMRDGDIIFVGKMNEGNLYHYHANYVNPDWSEPKKRVAAPTVRVSGQDVNLGIQRGSRHIFYVGIH
jgi:hypothetical protein